MIVLLFYHFRSPPYRGFNGARQGEGNGVWMTGSSLHLPRLSHLLHGLFVALRYHREREVRREHEGHVVEVSLDAYGTRRCIGSLNSQPCLA